MTLGDVEAVVGEAGAFATDEVMDAAFGGGLAGLDGARPALRGRREDAASSFSGPRFGTP